MVPEEGADDYLNDLIHNIISVCLEAASPRAACTIFTGDEITMGNESIFVCGQKFNTNKMVASALRKSTSLAVFIGTCGDGPELYSKKMIREGNSLEGLIADITGSEIAEGVADFIHKSIEKEMAARGLSTSNRFSPGYCKWQVEEQQKLFRVMGDNHCSVYLTGSSLMLPVKSVSGIAGIGKEVENLGYACSFCEMEQCLYRDLKR